jgi:hypothetical protein
MRLLCLFAAIQLYSILRPTIVNLKFSISNSQFSREICDYAGLVAALPRCAFGPLRLCVEFRLVAARRAALWR